MIVDGKKIAEGIISILEEDQTKFNLKGKKLAAVVAGKTKEIEHFLSQKKKVADKLGIIFLIAEFPEEISQIDFVAKIKEIGADPEVAGLIVQLPLPKHLDNRETFNAIPADKDIDLLSEESFQRYFLNDDVLVPPVVGAIEHLIKSVGMDLQNKSAVVLGAGKLIGIPSLAWLAKKSVSVTSFGVWSENVLPFLQTADIVIAGLGNPGILRGECLKNGVCVFDVGYTMIDGQAKGDVDFDSVKDKAELITPVPGGIGPLTVAVLFENLFKLAKLQGK